MKTLEEKIAVMQAALEGKQIQMMSAYTEGQWVNADKDILAFNWIDVDYRVKPEEPKQEYVPYESTEEFLQAQKEHGLIVVYESNKTGYTFVDCEGSVYINDGYNLVCEFPFLFKHYHWKKDGTPCGKLKK